jgi:hypothetical protein
MNKYARAATEAHLSHQKIFAKMGDVMRRKQGGKKADQNQASYVLDAREREA